VINSEYYPFRSPEAKADYLNFYDQASELWPVDSETREVETCCGRTFVRISGPASAPPLVLLPGYSAHSLMWLPNIAAFSEHTRTYAVDSFFDVGRSVNSRYVWRRVDFVDWLENLFDELELGDQVNLLGMSYGGWVAGQYGLCNPGRLQTLILIAPAFTVLPLNPAFVFHSVLSLLPHPYFKRSFSQWLFPDLLRQNETAVEYIEMSTQMAQRAYRIRYMAPPSVLKDEELAGIQVPTLYLVGENEQIYPAEAALARLQRVAPQIRTALIPEAGHDLTMAQAEMVNELVVGFLQEEIGDS
jgi:pimeloyl-ACP methyl ester carboxylesterase